MSDLWIVLITNWQAIGFLVVICVVVFILVYSSWLRWRQGGE